MESKRTVELTKTQCKNLADFIQFNIFDEIRNDPEIDNPYWLIEMMDAFQKLEEASKK